MSAVKARKQRGIVSKRVDRTKPAHLIINVKFRGLTRFCQLTGYPLSTAHGWTLIGFIPPRWRGDSTQPHILKIAAENGIKINAADFVEKPANDQNSAEPTTPPQGSDDSAAAAFAVPGEGLPPPAAAARPTIASDA